MQVITETTTKAVNKWNHGYISPGPVASIGDVLQNVRLKQTAPYMKMRWEFKDSELRNRGNNVQDGLYESYSNGGLGAITSVRDVYSDNTETKAVGDMMQNIVPSGLSVAPRMLGRPQDQWKYLTASLRRPAVMPLAMPGGYPREGVRRGNQPSHIMVASSDYEVVNMKQGNTGLGIDGRNGNQTPSICPQPPSAQDVKVTR